MIVAVQGNRKDAPPLPPLRKRGSEQMALQTARSPRSVDEAPTDCRRLTYAPGSMAATSSRLCGYERLSAELGWCLLRRFQLSRERQVIAVLACTLVKPINNTGGSLKTFQSLNLRYWHCKTLTGCSSGTGPTDKSERNKIGFVGPVAAQDQRTSSRCRTHWARTRSRRWFVHWGGCDAFLAPGDRTGAVGSALRHHFGKHIGFYGCSQTQCVKR